MPHPNAFSPIWFEGPEFFAKIIGVFNNFLPKKYEGFRSGRAVVFKCKGPGFKSQLSQNFFLYILPFKMFIDNFVKVHFTHKVLVKCEIHMHKYQN